MVRFEHGGNTYGCPPDLLDCSISLNPMGAPKAVLEGARRAVLDCARYPDPACRGLRRAIARRDGVEEGQILCGNGASDLIYRLALARKPRQALLLAPTFSEYRRALEGVGCQIREHRLAQEAGFLPGEELLTAIVPGVDLVFLCDPNNPTGRLMDGALLGRVLARCRAVGAFLAVDQCFLELTGGDPCRLTEEVSGGGLLLLRALTKSYALAGLRLGYALCVDQCFLELTGGDPCRLTEEVSGGGLLLLRALTKSYALAGLRLGYALCGEEALLGLTGGDPCRLTEEVSGGGLLLLRALTKSYALAGLRLGYALCGEEALLGRMEAAGPPWAVSIPAQAAGEIALQQFPRWPADSFRAIRRGREQLAAGLTALGLWVCPGDGNFLLFQGPEDLGRRLLEGEHILVRDCSSYSGLGPGWFRIGVRTEEENERLLTAAARQLGRD